jgi:hypothetical protein
LICTRIPNSHLGFGVAISAVRQSGARLQISHMRTKFDVIAQDWNNTSAIGILLQ